MIIYLHEDKPYIHWITHHRRGFVLAGHRKPKLAQLTLHRATCPEVKSATGKRTHLTTGSRFKACSIDAEELRQWCLESGAAALACCTICTPLDSRSAPPEETHVTKFGVDILDYLLEAAVIHFDDDSPPYRLTVGDIAACLGKTPAHTAQALRNLLNQELIWVRGRTARIAARTLVYPTIRAIRMLESYADASDDMIQRELEKLN